MSDPLSAAKKIHLLIAELLSPVRPNYLHLALGFTFPQSNDSYQGFCRITLMLYAFYP
jgi:hypothetical protein